MWWVDPASIEVPRRKRRAKTDRLDVHKLLKLLLRYHLGEPRVWSVVRVPSVEDEDNRHLHRELLALKRERTQHVNRIKGLLAGVGVRLPLHLRTILEQLEKARLWDGCHPPCTAGFGASTNGCCVSNARSSSLRGIAPSV